MIKRFALPLAALLIAGLALAKQTTLTIATVNNPDMIVMQKLTPHFEQQHPDIKINWVTLPENTLRQKVTTDIATNAGSYDILTIGTLEVPIWAKNGWLLPFNNLPASYDESDLLKPVVAGLSYKDTLYALPFYGESSMTYYRKDLFAKAGLSMSEHPTWKQIESFAKKLNDPSNNVYGVCLRGEPGWGENMAFFDTLVNTFGGRWFNMNWQAQLNTDAWKNATNFYVNLVTNYGPPGVTSNGFTENETLFANGQCAMWVDATVAAGYLSDPDNSKVADQVGFAFAPTAVTPNGSHWLWSWALAIPKSTKKADAARTFITWATSQDYIKLVAKTNGWVAVPPGTRDSTYKNPNYQKAAPFADIVEKSINSADPNHPTKDPVPYVGVQFVAIPEFEAIGTRVGQMLAGAVAGQTTVDQFLKNAQAYVSKTMKQAGYPK
jgi:sorbitol/mannitol transport system substrate-binding protein